MSEWKQAWQLSKIELKRMWLWIVISGIIFISMGILLGIGFPYYMGESPMLKENNPGLYDFIFLLLFWVVPYWMRPKEFRYHMVSSDVWLTPYFVKLMQLPIPDSVIMKHRFMTHMTLSIPYSVLFLLLFYLFSGITGAFISPVTFIAFAIIWMSFSVYAGYVFPASDAGDRVGPIKLVFLFILMGGIGLAAYMLIEFYSPYSLVEWTVLFATEWPILSSVISILLAFLGMRYYMFHMRRRMHKLDYLYG